MCQQRLKSSKENGNSTSNGQSSDPIQRYEGSNTSGGFVFTTSENIGQVSRTALTVITPGTTLTTSAPPKFKPITEAESLTPSYLSFQNSINVRYQVSTSKKCLGGQFYNACTMYFSPFHV